MWGRVQPVDRSRGKGLAAGRPQQRRGNRQGSAGRIRPAGRQLVGSAAVANGSTRHRVVGAGMSVALGAAGLGPGLGPMAATRSTLIIPSTVVARTGTPRRVATTRQGTRTMTGTAHGDTTMDTAAGTVGTKPRDTAVGTMSTASRIASRQAGTTTATGIAEHRATASRGRDPRTAPSVAGRAAGLAPRGAPQLEESCQADLEVSAEPARWCLRGIGCPARAAAVGLSQGRPTASGS